MILLITFISSEDDRYAALVGLRNGSCVAPTRPNDIGFSLLTAPAAVCRSARSKGSPGWRMGRSLIIQGARDNNLEKDTRGLIGNASIE